jgi:type VI secretion system FHA domain protein
MRLNLSIVAGPENTGRDTRSFLPGTFHIGRAANNDWILADPKRHLSKQHCSITFRNGLWEMTDLSTNGTFLNDEPEPIGARGVRDLRDGDRIRLGQYELGVAIGQDAQPVRFGAEQGADGGKLTLSFGLPNAKSFTDPVQPDHIPGIEEAYRPPRPVVLLDEDWDLATPVPSGSEAAMPHQAVRAGVLSDIRGRALCPEEPAPAPWSGMTSPSVAPATSSATGSSAVSVSGPPGDLMAAFLRGAGMTDVQPADPHAAMEMLGATFRAFTHGLRETLMARAAVKSEFRIEQTMIRAHGNNPLKFSASDEDALLSMLGAGRRTQMAPAAAVAEAFDDIRLHELATVAAMQTAVRSMLRELDPAKMRDATGGGLLEAQRKARAWEAFEAAHTRLSRAMTDNFESTFGRAFARAYQQALHETRPQEVAG